MRSTQEIFEGEFSGKRLAVIRKIRANDGDLEARESDIPVSRTPLCECGRSHDDWRPSVSDGNSHKLDRGGADIHDEARRAHLIVSMCVTARCLIDL